MSLRNFLIWLVKLPIKLSHQVAAIVLNWRKVRAFKLSFVTEAWASENMLGEIPGVRFFGVRIADVRVPLERIFVTNDQPNHVPGNLRPRFIPLEDSQRLKRVSQLRSRLSTQDSNSPPFVDLSQLTPTDEKILYLSKGSMNYSCSVILTVRGDALVIDGTHRLFATILRENSLDNINIFITI